jgi:hypothetical protein
MTQPPPRSFLIATPCDDGHKLCFWESLRAFEHQYHSGQLRTKHHFSSFMLPGDSLVPRARNNIAWSFLTQTAHDFLFQIDSDLDFRPEDLIRLADLAAGLDLDVLAALYAIKQDELRWCINANPGEKPDPATGLHKITMAPGGLHIVNRRVFMAMIHAGATWPHWNLEFDEDMTKRLMWNFYFNGVVRDPVEWPDKPNGRYLSEDWGFSYFARKLGFTIWLDTKTVALHRGECFYPRQARRLSREEVESGRIGQPDGSTTLINPPEPV